MNERQPSRIYLMHGMKRSGNHAITNWLMPQIDCTHFNNVIPIGEILRGRHIPDPEPFDQWHQRQQQLRSNEISAELLVTLEDHDLQLVPFKEFGLPVRRLLVLRDPRQLFSSRVRKAFRVDMPAYPRHDGPVMQRAVSLWKQHARCYLGGHDVFPGRLAIFYDAWFADIHYRAAISLALGVSFDDRGFGKVSAEGGGSSFDGTMFDGRPDLMAVTDRVAALETHEKALLEEIFLDQELLELCDAVANADPYVQLTLEC